jgi:DNA-binding NtrC family response regulator
VVARLIHDHSTRARSGLVALNCGGIPDSLLESELFGHTRGSFTDAYRDKPGLLEQAQRGTVFLDEIGEMSQRMQSLLLRFLESGELQRIGESRPGSRVDFRLVAATNRDLHAAMQDGAFRSDLYFRLNVIHIMVPPLRARPEDIPLLVRHFLSQCSRLHKVAEPAVGRDVMDRLCSYPWPGNVRELRNVAERLVLRAEGRPIQLTDLPPEIQRFGIPLRSPAPRGDDTQATLLLSEMLDRGQSFWDVVYEPFMSHDLTRADLRAIVHRGLGLTHGNYRTLVGRFNMPAGDYKRFLRFLRSHDCQLSFQTFRAAGLVRSANPEVLRPSA